MALFFDKGDNFCDFLFVFLHTKSLLKRDFTLKGKNSFPREVFPLRVDPFSRRCKEMVLPELSPLKNVSAPKMFQGKIRANGISDQHLFAVS